MIVHIRPGYSHQHTRVRASASHASKLLNRTMAARAAIGRQRFMAAAAPRSLCRDCRTRRERPGVRRQRPSRRRTAYAVGLHTLTRSDAIALLSLRLPLTVGY